MPNPKFKKTFYEYAFSIILYLGGMALLVFVGFGYIGHNNTEGRLMCLALFTGVGALIGSIVTSNLQSKDEQQRVDWQIEEALRSIRNNLLGIESEISELKSEVILAAQDIDWIREDVSEIKTNLEKDLDIYTEGIENGYSNWEKSLKS